jgi:hypothetical protein
MRPNLIALSFLAILGTSFAYAQDDTLVAGEAEEAPPTLDEIKATNEPWGLNIGLLEKRGAIARRLGTIDGKKGSEDFSSYVTIFQATKFKIGKLVPQKVALTREIAELEEHPWMNRHTIRSKQLELQNIDRQIEVFSETNSRTGKRIMALTGLESTQVAKLPPRASRADR